MVIPTLGNRGSLLNSAFFRYESPMDLDTYTEKQLIIGVVITYLALDHKAFFINGIETCGV